MVNNETHKMASVNIILLVGFKKDHYSPPLTLSNLDKNCLSPQGVLSITDYGWTGGDLMIVPSSI